MSRSDRPISHDQLHESVRADLAALRTYEEKSRLLLHEGFSPEQVRSLLGPSPDELRREQAEQEKQAQEPIQIARQSLEISRESLEISRQALKLGRKQYKAAIIGAIFALLSALIAAIVGREQLAGFFSDPFSFIRRLFGG